MVQTVLAETANADIAVYLVWEPVWGPEIDKRMSKAKVIATDPRIAQYSATTLQVAKAFIGPLGWKEGGPNHANGDMPWDVYMLYDATTRWESDAPAPRAWASPVVRGQLRADLNTLLASAG